jgi:poly(hydroxyalkanoate) granule-associated protein
MVKKLKSASEATSAPAGSRMDHQMAQTVKDSAQQIWLAGMGAFAKAQAEGGKAFETLIKEGLTLQKKTQGLAEEKISEVTGRMSAMAGTVTSKAGQNWDKLESIFEQRTAKALSRLGVPTAKDVETLTQRVEELAAAVARLSKATPGSPAKPAGKPTAAKTKSRAKSPAKAPAKAAAKRATRKSAGTSAA